MTKFLEVTSFFSPTNNFTQLKLTPFFFFSDKVFLIKKPNDIILNDTEASKLNNVKWWTFGMKSDFPLSNE